jgi:DNA-directed RNA polymerase beta' subunit
MGSVSSFFSNEIPPSNITLLFATADQVRLLRPVKVLDITDGMTANFHPDGLFSYDIFGKPGGELRNRHFSYVDLRVPMIHPTLYKILVRLDSLNEGILSGKMYATWDPKTKRFIKASPGEGETGFEFFVKHLPELTFEDRKAMSRRIGVKVIELHQKQPMISRLLVLPAGLRDYTVDDTGKPSEDEVNNFYRKIMRLCFSLDNYALQSNLQYLDSTRYNIQVAILELYNHLVNLLRGKKKAVY